MEGTRLEFSSQSGRLDPGVNDLEFSVTVVSNGNGAEVTGNGLWRLETFMSSNRDGSGEKNILATQTLTPDLSSRDFRSGSRLTFSNLAARIDRDQVNCQGNSFICVNLYKGERPSVDFKLEGTSPEALVHCREVSCVKKR